MMTGLQGMPLTVPYYHSPRYFIVGAAGQTFMATGVKVGVDFFHSDTGVSVASYSCHFRPLRLAFSSSGLSSSSALSSSSGAASMDTPSIKLMVMVAANSASRSPPA